MLTRQGWLVAGGAGGLIAAGRLLGTIELFVLGAAATVLVLLALGLALLVRPRLDVSRVVSPPRVHAGSSSRVELRMRNVGNRRTPVLRLFDPVSGTRGAELFIAPLTQKGTARAAYRLPTEHRGIVEVGPLEATLDDPFGLVSLSTQATPRTELTVYPKVDEIVPLPYTTGHDPHAGAEHPTALSRTGEDFYALRPYVVGDDLRRVHWPSTARRDELTVRQDELPWQGRVSVLLDVRRATHTKDSLEDAVSAAASVVNASWKRRDLIRLLTTDGVDLGFAAGVAHTEAVLEHLAVVQASAEGAFRGMVESMAQAPGGGGLVVIVGRVPDAELQSLMALRASYASLTLVQFVLRSDLARSDVGRSATAGHGTTLLRVTPDLTFADAWNRAMSRRGIAGRGRAARIS